MTSDVPLELLSERLVVQEDPVVLQPEGARQSASAARAGVSRKRWQTHAGPPIDCKRPRHDEVSSSWDTSYVLNLQTHSDPPCSIEPRTGVRQGEEEGRDRVSSCRSEARDGRGELELNG